MADGNAWRYALEALSTLGPAYLERRNLRRSNDQMDEGYAEVSRRQRNIDSEISDAVMDAGESTEGEVGAGLNDYHAALAAARARDSVSAAPIGGERAEQEAAGVAKQVGAHGGRFSNYLAHIDAPIRRNQNVGERLTRAGSAIATQQQGAGLSDYIARLRANRQRVNPLQNILFEIAGNIAQNWQGRHAGTAPQVRVRPNYEAGPMGPPSPGG